MATKGTGPLLWLRDDQPEHRWVETGGSCTVEVYDRVSPDAVVLEPDSDGDVRVVAELVEVLGR